MDENNEVDEVVISESTDDQQEFEELGDIPELYSFKDRAETWLNSKNEDIDEVRVYVYKFKKESSKREFVGRFDGWDEFPDELTIGQRYGSGKYLVSVQIPRTKQRPCTSNCFKFTVSEIFDKENLPVVSQAPVDPLKPITDILSTLVPVLSPFILPLLNNRSSGFAEMQKVMSEMQVQNMETINKIMSESTRENIKMVNELIKAKRDSVETIEDDETDDNSVQNVIAQYLPLIKEFIPILSGGGVAASSTAQIVKNLPQVKQLTKDNIALSALINYLEKDKDVGTEKVTKILQVLKIRRPAKK